MNNIIYDLIEIGACIRVERKKLKLTQSDLAVKLGLSEESRQTISKWEKGELPPNFDQMLKMCNIFNCELGHLLCEYSENTRALTDIVVETGCHSKSVANLKFTHSITNYEGINVQDEFISSKQYLEMVTGMAFIVSSMIKLKQRPRPKSKTLDNLPHGLPLHMLKKIGERDDVVEHLIERYGKDAVIKTAKFELDDKKKEIHKALDAFLDTLTA